MRFLRSAMRTLTITIRLLLLSTVVKEFARFFVRLPSFSAKKLTRIFVSLATASSGPLDVRFALVVVINARLHTPSTLPSHIHQETVLVCETEIQNTYDVDIGTLKFETPLGRTLVPPAQSSLIEVNTAPETTRDIEDTFVSPDIVSSQQESETQSSPKQIASSSLDEL